MKTIGEVLTVKEWNELTNLRVFAEDGHDKTLKEAADLIESFIINRVGRHKKIEAQNREEISLMKKYLNRFKQEVEK